MNTRISPRALVLLLCFVAALLMLSSRPADTGFHFRLDMGLASLSIESASAGSGVGITLAFGRHDLGSPPLASALPLFRAS